MKVSLEKMNYYPPKAWEHLETVLLQKKYVADSIGDAWKLWSKERAIIIKCQPGEGKTTFVENVLVKDAIKKEKKIIIASNRISQSIANKKRLMAMYDIANIYNDEGLCAQSYLGENIVVMSYQKLYRELDKINSNDYEYAIFDEMHYFMSDATFSSMTGALLRQIPHKFKNAKRVYISATADEVMPYIIEAETSLVATARYRFQHILNGVCCNVYDISDVQQRQAVARELMYASNIPLPIVYESKDDFKFLNIRFFNDFEILKEMIEKSNDKWIIFVTAKEFGESLSEYFKDSRYIDAETKNEDYGTFSDLIDKEMFEEKILICTSVFINGNNIKDKQVKNIVVFNLNPCDIKQAIGRRRIYDKKKEKVNVYLYIPQISQLTKQINENAMILADYDMSHKNPSKFSGLLLCDKKMNERDANKLYPKSYGAYAFGDLSIEKLKLDKNYMEKVKEMIEKNPIHYCKFVAKSFSLPFKKSMCELMVDGRVVIESKLEEFTKKSPVSKEEFQKISQEITTLRRKFKLISESDNFGENRPPLDYNAFNSRLKEFEFNYKVIKCEDRYLCIKM